EKTSARKMFDIAALKQQYAAAMSSQAPGGEDTRVNEVQDTIDSFKKRFE
ncbi:MAG: hypothetical protein GY697_07355, partial [Desulfobacterales bacterium]|nr:hypothetical protein [Desulfobacterales bacterium]